MSAWRKVMRGSKLGTGIVARTRPRYPHMLSAWYEEISRRSSARWLREGPMVGTVYTVNMVVAMLALLC